MFPWWVWVLIWVVILVGGAVLVVLRWRRTWRSMKALTREIGEAERLVAALEAETDRIEASSAEIVRELAVFTDPAQAREARLSTKDVVAAERRARRAERRPGWARGVE